MSDSALCAKCGYSNPHGVLRCSSCKMLLEPQVPLTSGEAHERTAAISVEVVDIAMPFWSMVIFMVKWAVASIPAFIILIAVLSSILAMFAAMLAPFMPAGV